MTGDEYRFETNGSETTLYGKGFELATHKFGTGWYVRIGTNLVALDDLLKNLTELRKLLDKLGEPNEAGD